MRRHDSPGNEPLIHRPQPAAEQAAEQVEKLDGGIRVHLEYLLEQ